MTEMLTVAKFISAGIGVVGSGAGIGTVYARSPSTTLIYLCHFGFAISEATGLFCLMLYYLLYKSFTNYAKLLNISHLG